MTTPHPPWAGQALHRTVVMCLPASRPWAGYLPASPHFSVVIFSCMWSFFFFLRKIFQITIIQAFPPPIPHPINVHKINQLSNWDTAVPLLQPHTTPGFPPCGRPEGEMTSWLPCRLAAFGLAGIMRITPPAERGPPTETKPGDLGPWENVGSQLIRAHLSKQKFPGGN